MHKKYKKSAITLVVQAAFLSVVSSLSAIASAADGGISGAQLFAQAERDALFGGDEISIGKDELFGEAGGTKNVAAKSGGAALKGYLQTEIARTYGDPSHWSKLRLRSEMSAAGALSESVKYRIGARVSADAAYSGEKDYYPVEVRRDRRAEAELRESYLDVNAGALDLRLGRQHVIWGEMVGLYFADVVSARDLTEFILPDFESQRIPQWAARAEYFSGDFHGELLWIPIPGYDRIGRFGGDFYPVQAVPAGVVAVYNEDEKPDRKLSNTNYGARISGLVSGWDLSAFYYESMDVAQTFYRQIVAPATFVFQPKHERIKQIGGTLTKDFGTFVLKSEAVHTEGRKFPVLRLADQDGLADSATIDWAVGFDFSLGSDFRLNTQVFQRDFRDHDPDMITKPKETGYSLYLTAKMSDSLEAQFLWISSFDREDWLARPKLNWNFEKNWRAIFGADVFKGPQLGLFGQYGNQDRVFLEARYSF